MATTLQGGASGAIPTSGDDATTTPTPSTHSGLVTDLEDFALGTTGVIDEVDQYVGVPTDFAADTYALFNGPQTKASAVAAEQGGLIDAAAGATLTQIKTAFTSNTTAIVIGLLLFGGAIATGYYYGSK
jgi:hypothetical protein